MAVKIYGSIQSTCTQRVIFTALELGIDYDLHDINMMNGEHKSASYILAKSAKDSGKTALYFCTNEPVTVDLREQLASIEYSNFDSSMARLGYEKMFKRFMDKGEANDVVVEAATRNLLDALDHFDKVLTNRPYLSDHGFGLLDIYDAPWINFLPTI
ncbi:hypothetical protein BU23DRAFT_625542 [Bimuria novae-zelandiae CBS 107.79]|uniref:glutathione transferase n=1 Tax=Bimuria novae-zelandiae CBS 107.79 TaxID=1447943 RepID=A0A6A5VUR2_9PLEO|nr:hypothetical protein BU23DRAFT_625542 [Bimuria novae-zelandiae CBS 107.79]